LIAAKDSPKRYFFALALFEKEKKGSPGAGHLVSPTKVEALAVSITKRNLDFLRVEDLASILYFWPGITSRNMLWIEDFDNVHIASAARTEFCLTRPRN